MQTRALAIAAVLASGLSACGGGGGGAGSATPPSLHSVTIAWQPNRETGVNSAGGGYLVSISGQGAPINVPYNAASGVTPTSATVSLWTGIYTAKVSAYAALDAQGAAAGSQSASSAPLTIYVP